MEDNTDDHMNTKRDSKTNMQVLLYAVASTILLILIILQAVFIIGVSLDIMASILYAFITGTSVAVYPGWMSNMGVIGAAAGYAALISQSACLTTLYKRMTFEAYVGRKKNKLKYYSDPLESKLLPSVSSLIIFSGAVSVLFALTMTSTLSMFLVVAPWVGVVVLCMVEWATKKKIKKYVDENVSEVE